MLGGTEEALNTIMKVLSPKIKHREEYKNRFISSYQECLNRKTLGNRIRNRSGHFEQKLCSRAKILGISTIILTSPKIDYLNPELNDVRDRNVDYSSLVRWTLSNIK